MDHLLDWNLLENFFQLNFSPSSVFLITGLALLLYVSIWGLVAIVKNRADLADIAWGMGFFLVSWVSFFLSPFSINTLIVNILITIWALRLAIHIYLRSRNREEDFRYQKLKKKWGKNVSLKMFFQVFLLQGVILYIIALPILWMNTHHEELTFSAIWFVFPFWLSGFLTEAIGDYQLLRFQKNPLNQGKLLTTGFWGYVRHPNYLGEIIQWWSIWSLTLFLPLIISPILITFLLIKVSGAAPLEEKMKSHPDFLEYTKKTPSLFPFPLINGTLYMIGWFVIIYFGSNGSFWIPFSVFVFSYVLQICLFYKYDKNSLVSSVLLSIYILVLGVVQEIFFINFSLVKYPDHLFFPPFWLIYLYPLFALTLNSSLQFLNRNLLFSFFIGGFGALFSYLSGARLKAVVFLTFAAYPILFISWGVLLGVLIVLNRRLIALQEKYTNPERIGETLTVFFDNSCPVCSTEMNKLQKREQTGHVIYACPQSDEELKKITNQFTYKEAMKKIHAIKSNGEILKGTEALSELYSRTNLPFIAMTLQAPIFREIGILLYAIWAQFRRSTNK